MLLFVFLFTLFEEPIYEVETIVITATRYPIALKDVALATIVVEKDEIERLNAKSISEALQTHAGISIKDYGNPGSVPSVAIRGIPSSGILILVDGHPLNSAATGMADIGAININTVERLEIVKGPVSSLYGANALAGVINIITQKEYNRPEFVFRPMISTDEFEKPIKEKDFSLGAGTALGKVNLAMGSAYRTGSSFRSNSDYENFHARGRLGYKMQRLNLNASFTYDHKEFGVPGPMPIVDSLHPLPVLGDSFATSLYDQEADEIMLGDLSMSLQLRKNLDWTSDIFLDRKGNKFHTLYTDWLGDTVTEDYDYRVYTIGLNTKVSLQLGRTDFILGLDLRYDTLEIVKNSIETGDTAWYASSPNVGAWFETKASINNVLLCPSVRFDHNPRFGDFLSPQIGLVSMLGPKLRTKLSIGKAFRTPTFNDMYWPIYGNPNLKPEHGWAYELRFETSLSGDWFSALSLFMRQVRDRIFWLPRADGLWQPQNVNYLAIKGFEFEINRKINTIGEITIEMTYLNARQHNDEIVYEYYDWLADTSHTTIEEIERDAAFTPKYALASRLDLNLPYGFVLNVAGIYNSERTNYYPNYLDYPYVQMDKKILATYMVVNTSIRKEFGRYLTLSLGAKNLFDIAYATQFGNTIDDLDYPMPPRTVFAQLVLGN